MKSQWKKIFVVSAALTLLAFVSNARAQYGTGACAPTCDVPSYEPSCEPTCDVPSYEPTCDAGAVSYGCAVGSCYGGCDLGFGCLISGTLNAAISPLKWLYCEFTDGIYPDCGCAPLPEKEPCNPCTICGDYVGGCNDNCDGYGVCGGQCYEPQGGSYINAGVSGVYSSAVYDSEAYDASPTRGGQALPTLPINGKRVGEFSMNRARNFNVQELVGNTKSTNVRPVAYERGSVEKNKVRVASNQVPNQKRAVPVQQKTQVSRAAVNNRELQKKQNVRVVERVNSNNENGANAKTFGIVRAVK